VPDPRWIFRPAFPHARNRGEPRRNTTICFPLWASKNPVSGWKPSAVQFRDRCCNNHTVLNSILYTPVSSRPKKRSDAVVPMEMTPQVLRWSAGGKVLFPIQRRSDTSHVLSIKQLHSLRSMNFPAFSFNSRIIHHRLPLTLTYMRAPSEAASLTSSVVVFRDHLRLTFIRRSGFCKRQHRRDQFPNSSRFDLSWEIPACQFHKIL
jgi:hypothetical protein